jgi:hypothetical protein
MHLFCHWYYFLLHCCSPEFVAFNQVFGTLRMKAHFPTMATFLRATASSSGENNMHLACSAYDLGIELKHLLEFHFPNGKNCCPAMLLFVVYFFPIITWQYLISFLCLCSPCWHDSHECCRKLGVFSVECSGFSCCQIICWSGRDFITPKVRHGPCCTTITADDLLNFILPCELLYILMTECGR